MSEHQNPYEAASEIMRPLAMKKHVDDTITLARGLLEEGDIDGALWVLWQSLPRFERLGGLPVLEQINQLEADTTERRAG